jgi:hypothetical protein
LTDGSLSDLLYVNKMCYLYYLSSIILAVKQQWCHSNCLLLWSHQKTAEKMSENLIFSQCHFNYIFSNIRKTCRENLGVVKTEAYLLIYWRHYIQSSITTNIYLLRHAQWLMSTFCALQGLKWITFCQQFGSQTLNFLNRFISNLTNIFGNPWAKKGVSDCR